ncbi:polysaccharide deacetylase family protein [Janibacter limosus]|nr:polysaccharide deacetylase family protein [Janibacter limosus]
MVGLSRQRLRDDSERTCAAITQITGTRPRWYRPPFGITTRASRDAARDAGLTPVLWTARGRDWSRWVGPAGITRRVELTLRPGGTVLLHDTDRYASPGSWRRTDAALDTLLTRWASSGVPVGPLAEHWSRDEVAPISRCRPGPAGPPSP